MSQQAKRAHLLSKYEIDDTTGCWLWSAGRDSHGYGSLNWEGRTLGAHRWFYQQLVGPIPAGLQLDHLCRVRHCVNPEHLEPVTPRTNTLRGLGSAAQRHRQTHCIHGHEFTPENTYLWRGCRICRACHSERQKRRSAS